MTEENKLEKLKKEIEAQRKEIKKERAEAKAETESKRLTIELATLKNRKEIAKLKKQKEKRDKTAKKFKKALSKIQSGIKSGAIQTAKTIQSQQSAASVEKRQSEVFGGSTRKAKRGKKLKSPKIRRQTIPKARPQQSAQFGLGFGSAPTGLSNNGVLSGGGGFL
jgi:hypothetical protein